MQLTVYKTLNIKEDIELMISNQLYNSEVQFQFTNSINLKTVIDFLDSRLIQDVT